MPRIAIRSYKIILLISPIYHNYSYILSFRIQNNVPQNEIGAHCVHTVKNRKIELVAMQIKGDVSD